MSGGLAGSVAGAIGRSTASGPALLRVGSAGVEVDGLVDAATRALGVGVGAVADLDEALAAARAARDGEGALVVALFGNRPEVEIRRVGRSLGGRSGTIPAFLVLESERRDLGEIALADGFCDVLVRGRFGLDDLVRALRFGLEASRRQALERRLERLRSGPAAHAEALLSEALGWAAQGRIVGAVDHAIRNALQSAVGFSEILEIDLPPGSRDADYVRLVLGALERTLRLLDLRAARPAGGGASRVRPDAAIGELSGILGGMLGAGQRLRLAVEPSALELDVSVGRFALLLLNLVAAADLDTRGGELELRGFDRGASWHLEAWTRTADSGVEAFRGGELEGVAEGGPGANRLRLADAIVDALVRRMEGTLERLPGSEPALRICLPGRRRPTAR